MSDGPTIHVDLINALCNAVDIDPGGVKQIHVVGGVVIFTSWLRVTQENGEVVNITDDKGNFLLTEAAIPIEFPPPPREVRRRAARAAKKTNARLPRKNAAARTAAKKAPARKAPAKKAAPARKR